MSIQMLPDGVWPVMLTPFLDNGSIDWVAYDELIDFYIEHGASGLFATCLSGEIADLGAEECIELAAHAVQKAAGRVPVVAGGICFGDIGSMAEYAMQIGGTGVNAVVLSSNQFAAAYENEEALRERLFNFLNRMDPSVFLGIYECPYPYHRLVSASLLKDIAHTGRFLFMKDTCADITVLRGKIQAVQGTPMRLYNAHAQSLIDSARAGAAGYSGIGTNFFFKPYLAACRPDACSDDQVAAVHDMIECVQKAIRDSGAYPAFAKYYLNRQGLGISMVCRTKQFPTGDWSVLADLLKKRYDRFLCDFEAAASLMPA